MDEHRDLSLHLLGTEIKAPAFPPKFLKNCSLALTEKDSDKSYTLITSVKMNTTKTLELNSVSLLLSVSVNGPMSRYQTYVR